MCVRVCVYLWLCVCVFEGLKAHTKPTGCRNRTRLGLGTQDRFGAEWISCGYESPHKDRRNRMWVQVRLIHTFTPPRLVPLWLPSDLLHLT